MYSRFWLAKQDKLGDTIKKISQNFLIYSKLKDIVNG
jgi:hypothetical protein